jgi:hypothetical protein
MNFILLIIILVVALIAGIMINSKEFIPLVLTAVVAICGWFIGHELTIESDRINKQRDIRIEYLVSAYRRLANASMRAPQPNSQYFRDMESAMADIQLFGTEIQINQARTFMEEFQKTGKGPMDDLLNNLRNDLRKEMNLSETKINVQWFRPDGAPNLGIEKHKNE